ncbi:MAG: prolyl oligopeptidase family serine peptidase [Gemmatimonadetes bacterium]|nr:prolyl oligopeptidase family serine peptidase [Gemmatimonadota bacterium]
MTRRSMLASALVCTLLATAPTPGVAQRPFTVDDALGLQTIYGWEISPDGSWIVASVGELRGRIGVNAHRTGDPTYVNPSATRLWLINTATGDRQELFDGPVEIGRIRTSPTGAHFAVTRYRDGAYRLGIYDVERGRFEWPSLPDGTRLAGEQGQSPIWSSDGSELFLQVRADGWAEAAQVEFDRLTRGPITVYRGDDPFLAWEALRRQGAEVAVLALNVDDGSVREILPPTQLGRDGLAVAEGRLVYAEDVTEKTSYDVIFGSSAEIRTIDAAQPDPEAAVTLLDVPENRRLTWSRKRTHYAYADEGDVYFGAITGGEPARLTGSDEEGEEGDSSEDGEGEDEEEDAEDEPERFNVQGVSPDGASVLASTDAGIWLIDVETRERILVIERPEDEDERETAPRYTLLDWSPDEAAIYFQYASRTEWDRGVMRWDRSSGDLRELMRDERIYSGFALSEDGSTWVYRAASGNRPYDLYVASADFSDSRRLVESNPALASKALGRTELIDYLDVDGDRLYGVLYYPVDYVEGAKVPTVFLVYETFFDDRFNSTIALLNNAGYAVMQPSVDLEIGFPGEAWLKGVTAAANTLIERGIADPDRLGVHGTSYGGYATNLLVTQTDRFAAAINISGKVDMISFYTDSPRLGVRNIHAPENSQDRIGATLWEQPHKYIAHSAVMFADRIDTPLLLMTGEQDHNVPARTTLEMYYALRRLGKDVEWVNYTNGGHGMPRATEAEVRDYYARILEWYDRHLGADDATATTEQGGGAR